MSQILVGTCGICGGAITVPGVWGGIIPPTPSCTRCRAIPADAHGPVRQMKLVPAVKITDSAGEICCKQLVKKRVMERGNKYG